MRNRKMWMCLWITLILSGIAIGVYPWMQRRINQNEMKKVVDIYLQGGMPSEEILQGETMLGVLWVPKIKCLLPIWEGTGSEVLEKGAGHMEGSSKITDAAGHHIVLCAHCGLPQLYAFDRIDTLEKEDTIYVISHDHILVYTVTKQSRVLPEEVHLLLQPSQFANEITLLTCTPYGINTHRLLVQAELSRSIPLDGGLAA